MKKRIKSKLVWHLPALMNLNMDKVIGPSRDNSIRLRLGWWIEYWLESLFGWAYVGSNQETVDAIEFAQDDVPDRYLTPLQIEVKRRLIEFVDAKEAA